jgi:hypothetical protein
VDPIGGYMPKDSNEGMVELEQYEKDKETFSSTVDALMSADDDKTDEEIIKELDGTKDKDDETNAASGDATKDSTDSPDDSTPKLTDSIDDLIAADQSGAEDKPKTPDPDTDSTNVSKDDWQQKAELAEAELKKERQKTASWGGRITKANTRVTELEAELVTLKEAKPSEPDPTRETETAVLEKFRKDFPELGEAFDILEKRIDGNKPAKAKDPEPAPASPDANVDSTGDTTHLDTIRKVHPDLDEMVNTGVLRTWINQQADYMRPHLDQIYKTGQPQQVIDMVKRFKEASGWKSQLDQQGSKKKQTKDEKLANLKEVNSESGGAPPEGPDKNDYDGAAKEAFSEK